jgi:hypothetical protein
MDRGIIERSKLMEDEKLKLNSPNKTEEIHIYIVGSCASISIGGQETQMLSKCTVVLAIITLLYGEMFYPTNHFLVTADIKVHTLDRRYRAICSNLPFFSTQVCPGLSHIFHEK